MGRFPLMFIYFILYHLWGVLGLSVVVVSIDSHSENPRFPVPFVDTHSFVPTALTPHPTNTALFSKWCWCESSDKTHASLFNS